MLTIAEELENKNNDIQPNNDSTDSNIAEPSSLSSYHRLLAISPASPVEHKPEIMFEKITSDVNNYTQENNDNMVDDYDIHEEARHLKPMIDTVVKPMKIPWRKRCVEYL